MYAIACICFSAGIPDPTVGLALGTGRGGIDPSQADSACAPASLGPASVAPGVACGAVLAGVGGALASKATFASGAPGPFADSFSSHARNGSASVAVRRIAVRIPLLYHAHADVREFGASAARLLSIAH